MYEPIQGLSPPPQAFNESAPSPVSPAGVEPQTPPAKDNLFNSPENKPATSPSPADTAPEAKTPRKADAKKNAGKSEDSVSVDKAKSKKMLKPAKICLGVSVLFVVIGMATMGVGYVMLSMHE
ncbi:hypothetical protein M3Y97_01165600 [Aphelenchoides bicaudatus]|nr:hypothetical protein M3Y97_01165600 [Aphelenchoides bicaudatus]